MKGWIKLNSNQISTNLMLRDLGRELETLINLQYNKQLTYYDFTSNILHVMIHVNALT
jgi:hypothetical protein